MAQHQAFPRLTLAPYRASTQPECWSRDTATVTPCIVLPNLTGPATLTHHALLYVHGTDTPCLAVRGTDTSCVAVLGTDTSCVAVNDTAEPNRSALYVTWATGSAFGVCSLHSYMTFVNGLHSLPCYVSHICLLSSVIFLLVLPLCRNLLFSIIIFNIIALSFHSLSLLFIFLFTSSQMYSTVLPHHSAVGIACRRALAALQKMRSPYKQYQQIDRSKLPNCHVASINLD